MPIACTVAIVGKQNRGVMCGIAGFYSASGGKLPDTEVQQKVLDSLQSRGPDGFGIWKQPGNTAVLMHRRLSIQDLSETGAQPMHSDDGNLVITFNGEIYNAPELRGWLPDS